MDGRASHRLGGPTVVVGRVLLLLAAAIAVAVAFVMVGGAEDAGAGLAYGCPMHPEVVAAAPGPCPICRMALQRRAHGPHPARAPAAPGALALPEGTALADGDIGAATLLRVAREMLAPAWLEDGGTIAAILYRDEIPLLDPEEPAVFLPSTPGAEPRAPAVAHLVGEPATAWDAATARVRLRPDRGERRPRGQTGWVKFAARTNPALVVPRTAVLYAPTGPYVIVAARDGRSFRRRSVALGRTLFSFATVVAGLEVGEALVAQNAILLEAEAGRGAGPEPSAEAAP